jgi:hypothetical protein
LRLPDTRPPSYQLDTSLASTDPHTNQSVRCSQRLDWFDLTVFVVVVAAQYVLLVRSERSPLTTRRPALALLVRLDNRYST